MPHQGRSAPRHLGRAAAYALTGGLASTAMAANGVQWRLEARVPVICAILAVETPAGRPDSLAIATSCNAERFRLVLHQGTQQAVPHAARSSAGPVQISGSAVTISSLRPGYALTTIELSGPLDAAQVSVTLQPI